MCPGPHSPSGGSGSAPESSPVGEKGEERVNQEGGETEYRQEIPASSDMKKMMIYNAKCTCTYSVHVQYTCMCNSSTHSS